jgi:hypothetical protein
MGSSLERTIEKKMAEKFHDIKKKISPSDSIIF